MGSNDPKQDDAFDAQENVLLPPSVILVDLAEADWKLIDPSKRSAEVQRLVDFLGTRIRGQHRAIDAVGDAYEEYLSGKRRAKQPLCALIFLGPAGHGKSEIVSAFTEYLLGDENALTTIDATEYFEKHEVARLTGAPPGYVGHEAIPILAQDRLDFPAWQALHQKELRAVEGSRDALNKKFQAVERKKADLLRRISEISGRKNHPERQAPAELHAKAQEADTEMERIEAEYYAQDRRLEELRFRPGEVAYPSILLLEEIEKGHKQLHYILLQIMWGSRLTINRPQEIIQERSGERHIRDDVATVQRKSRTDFHNCFVFMTSNLGRNEIESLLRGERILGFTSGARPVSAPEELSDEIYKVAMAAYRKAFPAEFRRRVDEVVVFRPFTDDELRLIVNDKLKLEGQQFMAEEGIYVLVSNDFVEYILNDAKEHPEEGAGLILKKVRSRLIRPLRRAVRNGEIRAGDAVIVRLAHEKGKPKVEYAFDERTRKTFEQRAAGKKPGTEIEIRLKPEEAETTEGNNGAEG